MSKKSINPKRDEKELGKRNAKMKKWQKSNLSTRYT